MDTTAYIALSRSMALDRQMTNIANNLANTTTTGYRAEHSEFETVLEKAGEPRKLAFVQDGGMIRDMSAGAIEQTGNDLDLAIDGDAFFSLQTKDGVRYSRAGHFQLNSEGQLTTADGALLLGDDNTPVTLPDQPGKVSIAADGTLTTDQGIGQKIALARFADPRAMQREGAARFAAEAAPQPAEDARIIQGAVEQSNVQPVREITLMIDTQRAFEGSMRMIETHHDLELKAIDKIANVQA